MKDTKPQKESGSARSYRFVEGDAKPTPPDIAAPAANALALLAARGTRCEGGGNPGDATWRVETETPDGVHFDVSCTGPDLPGEIAPLMAHPANIPKERPWTGTYRLVVKAPLVVFDIYWKPDEPLRIMNFSRGDWERELAALEREPAA